MASSFNLNGKLVGAGHPCYIIAEAGVNHNGSLEMALQLVKAAKDTGADCVKFQTFKAKRLTTKSAPKADYQLETTEAAESQQAMLERLELAEEDYKKIMTYCAEVGIHFMSTPFNRGDVDFLVDLGVSAFKVSSMSLVEPDFLQYIASKGKPMIISTGMGTMAEVYHAVQAIRETGLTDLAVLQCTTNYPARLQDANIKCMKSIGDALDVVIGYSDHVPNNAACYAAVALGASVLEKHFTLDNSLPGPDHSCSLNISDFTELCTFVRNIELALGGPVKSPSEAEVANMPAVRRSLVLAGDISAGTVLTRNHLTLKRPLCGLPANKISNVLGRQVTRNIKADSALQMSDINWN